MINRSLQLQAIQVAFIIIITASSSLCAQTNIYPEAIAKTYAEMRTLAQFAQFLPGQRYKITDYETCWLYQYTDVAGDGTSGNEWTGCSNVVEPLIVTAVSASQLDKVAVSTLAPDDIIFYQLDPSEYARDFPANAKGVIYYRENPLKQVSFNHDYRTIKNIRWNNGSGLYNVSRKVDASDTSDYRFFHILADGAEAFRIARRGSPDNSNYRRSNVVFKHFFGALRLNIEQNSDTIYYDPKTINAFRNELASFMNDKNTFVSGDALRAGTTVVEVGENWFRVSQKPLKSGSHTLIIYTGDYGNNAVVNITSGTNLTVEGLCFDNSIHVCIGSSFNKLTFNTGVTLSGVQFTDFQENNFSSITASSGYRFARSTASQIFDCTFLGDIESHHFLVPLRGVRVESVDKMSAFGEPSSSIEGTAYGSDRSLTFDHFRSIGFGTNANIFIPPSMDSITVYSLIKPPAGAFVYCTDCYTKSGLEQGVHMGWNGTAWRKTY